VTILHLEDLVSRILDATPESDARFRAHYLAVVEKYLASHASSRA
jgi:hypothetical protein